MNTKTSRSGLSPETRLSSSGDCNEFNDTIEQCRARVQSHILCGRLEHPFLQELKSKLAENAAHAIKLKKSKGILKNGVKSARQGI
jgi:hypothetical protein